MITRLDKRRPSPVLGADPLFTIAETILGRLFQEKFAMSIGRKNMSTGRKNVGS